MNKSLFVCLFVYMNFKDSLKLLSPIKMFIHYSRASKFPGSSTPSYITVPHLHVAVTQENRIRPQFNLLKLTGHVMHHQFNIQQLYVLPTLSLCVLYLSENKQRLVPLTA